MFYNYWSGIHIPLCNNKCIRGDTACKNYSSIYRYVHYESTVNITDVIFTVAKVFDSKIVTVVDISAQY